MLVEFLSTWLLLSPPQIVLGGKSGDLRKEVVPRRNSLVVHLFRAGGGNLRRAGKGKDQEW